MNKVFLAIIILVTLCVGYVAAGPFISSHQLKDAIARQDAILLSNNIDFPRLRTNLKEQLNALLVKQFTSDMAENPFLILGMAFLPKLVDGLVDSMLTPSGIAQVMAGKNRKKLGRSLPLRPRMTNDQSHSEMLATPTTA